MQVLWWILGGLYLCKVANKSQCLWVDGSGNEEWIWPLSFLTNVGIIFPKELEKIWGSRLVGLVSMTPCWEFIDIYNYSATKKCNIVVSYM